MKILINTNTQLYRTEFLIEYLRDVYPNLLQDVILIDNTGTNIIRNWASEQKDFTYVYFDEVLTMGTAFNQVIEGLELNDELLITDNYHIPLLGSYEHLLSGLDDNADSFAVGPVSNSFLWEQHIDWTDAESAFEWSEKDSELAYEEVLFLYSGVILFRRNAVSSDQAFCEDAADIDNMIVEKCIREFMSHGRMHICKTSGFWDVRGADYRYTVKADIHLLEKTFGIHYLNVRGNDLIISTIEECDLGKDDNIRILEIGCDCGGTLFRLKKMFNNARLYGTDINEGALKYASEFAEVKLDNIEDHRLDFGENDFDIIIFGDVLEHLRDPLGTIQFCKELLKPQGRIIASIPNLMNIEVMRQLLDGDFTYSEIGLLDRTHIHMFTYNEIFRMFVDEAGYVIERIKMSMNGNLSEENDRLADDLVKLGNAEKFMYQAYEYQVVAKPESNLS